jgi:hypothetical protein
MRAKANDDVLGVFALQFEEVAIVGDLDDQFLDVVRLVGVVRDQRVEREVEAVGGILRRQARRLFAVVRRQEADEAANHHQGFDVVLESEVGDAGLGGMGDRAAEFFGGHVFVGHRLDHFRAGDEHVRRVLDHEDEVGHRRAIDRAAGAGPHDQRNLRHHARGENVALEDVGVTGERRDTFLDARPAGVVETDHRGADLDRVVHDLADLFGVRFRQRAAEDGEIL